MLYFASKPVARWLDPKGVVNESPLDAALLALLVLSAMAILTKRRIAWGKVLHANRWFLVLLGYTFVSAIVLQGDPVKNLKQWVRLAGSVMMAMTLLSEQDPRRALEAVLARMVYVLIPLSVVLIKYYPDLGVEYRAWNGEKFWVGAALQKNGLGRLCLVSAIFLLWRLLTRSSFRGRGAARYRSYGELLLLIAIAWMLTGSENDPMTAIVVLLTCAAVLIWLLRGKPTHRSFSIAKRLLYAGGLALMTMSLFALLPTRIAESIGRDPTFTGRTYIWDETRSIGWEHPILGVGFGGYWDGYRDFPVVGTVNEGHNGYLDSFVETGALGVLLVVLVVVSAMRRVQHECRSDYAWACLRIVVLLLIVVHNFTETSFLRPTTHLWVLFTYLCVVVPGRPRRKVVAGPNLAQAFSPAAVTGRRTLSSSR